MPRRWTELPLLVLLSAACQAPIEPDPDRDPGGRPDPTTTTAIDPCVDAPLGGQVDPAMVNPWQSAWFEALDAAGPVQFELIDSPSGAILDEASGAYIAGPVADVVDRVRIWDALCDASVDVDLPVVSEMTVIPPSGTILPNASYVITVEGGSGQFHCELLDTASGATLTDCDYAAGGQEGTDLVRVTDDQTGQTEELAWTIAADAEMALYGQRLFLPLGHVFSPTWVGGTGAVNYTITGTAVQAVGRDLLGVEEGRADIVAIDPYAGLQVAFTVDVVAARVPSIDRDSERQDWGVIVDAGDLDGDGYRDAILSSVDTTVTAYASGAAYVFAGGPLGLDPTPVQALGWPQEKAWSGKGAAIGDVNGDGEPDLVIGSPDVDMANTDNGGVQVNLGIPGGWFEPEPWFSSTGIGTSELGFQVAACDVDGDGTDDLLVSEPRDDTDPPIDGSDFGSLQIWQGGASLRSDPDWVAWGWVPDDMGGWTLVDNTEAGERMETGDLDGDGRCDVVVTDSVHSLDGTGDDGVVWVFLGADLTGYDPQPTRIYTDRSLDDDVRLGRGLVLADFDGDGLDDIAMGARNWDESSSENGAAFVFLSTLDDGRPSHEPVYLDEANWWMVGDGSGDELGISLSAGDFDGDGVPDLVVGGNDDETDDSTGGAGAVHVFSGTDIVATTITPRTRLDAMMSWGGDDSNMRFGRTVGALEDADGDGITDLLVFASRDDLDGVDVGAGYYITGATGELTRLTLTGDPGGAEVGARGSFTRIDADGDGDLDLMMGGWEASLPDLYDAGQVWWFEMTSELATAELAFPSPPDHSSSDGVGRALAVTDFDADGRDDLVVVAWGEDQDQPPDYPITDPDGCAVDINNTGAAWITLATGSGLETVPAFVAYGPEVNDEIETAAGGFDFDGDGREDLLIGTAQGDGKGAVSLFHGRSPIPGETVVLCPVTTLYGVTSGSDLGEAIAALGDLDGDGCDEIAVGAPDDDHGETNQGTARVIWGTGSPGCGPPEVTTLVPDDSFARAGSAVAGGGDVDGDGINDLVIGGYSYDLPLTNAGAMWLVSGATLVTLARDPIQASALPADGATTTHRLPDVATLRTAEVEQGEMGRSAALVDDPARPGQHWIAVSWHGGDLGGVEGAGGVLFYGWLDDDGSGSPGLSPEPVALFGGETGAPWGELGSAVVGQGTWLSVGARRSHAAGTEVGAVYSLQVLP